MKEDKPEVEAFNGDYEDVWDDVGAPSCETELLKVAIAYPGIDPYAVVSGGVRGVAVDRWCNNLSRTGYIDGWEEDDGRIWIWATLAGKKLMGFEKIKLMTFNPIVGKTTRGV